MHDAERLVVDASVVVAVVASGSARVMELARRLAQADLYAPAVLPAEIDSALRGLELGRKLTRVQAAAARRHAHRLPIELWPWEVLGERAWELRHNCSTYDGGYVALAERIDARLVTGDARLIAAHGVRCPVDVIEI
ncbi:type II toxin-antitoxin system VapC family toxin [Microbacterium gorillae]|uniref:type II toxin-antitoxin system VapC family toxin n=1 Tax=Microbacterium gorillae TaxID=1231063 RepID=UPI003D9871E8